MGWLSMHTSPVSSYKLGLGGAAPIKTINEWQEAYGSCCGAQ